MPPRTILSTSIAPNEVVFPRTTVSIESRSPLDAESAQGGIVIPGVSGRVRLSLGGRRATWMPEGEFPPGHHTLLVRELLTRSRHRIEDELRVPFFVTDSRAKVPRSVRVDSMARLRLKELETDRVPCHRRPTGKFIEMMKASHRVTGAPVALSFDQSGRRIDAERLLQDLSARRARRFGKLHETLYAYLGRAKQGGRVPVALWLRSDTALRTGQKSSRRPMLRPPKQELSRRKAVAALTERLGRVIEGEYGVHQYNADPSAPVLYAELTPEQVHTVAKRPEVLGVFLHQREGIEDLVDSMAIANSDDVHSLGFKGSGVKVAVWEDGPDVTTNLSIAASYLSSGFATSQHARHTHGIVKNIESRKPHGHAPSSSLHSANSKDLAALRWAAQDKGCTVISQSFHRSSEPGSSTMSFDDIYKDWLALRWPFPTICQAAGNFWMGDPDNINPPAGEYVNHKGYNGLTVGNHDDTAGAMSGDSVFRNPSSTHGDRELPEIAANGTSVTTVGLTMSGTSMASPAAAGCVALLQNADPVLKSWPEGCRAILLAGAKRNVVANTWWQDVVANVDASDGTGAVDAFEGVAIAKQRRGRNASASIKGWDVGTLSSADIGSASRTTFSYLAQVPRWPLGPRHVKVALAWDSKITTLSFLGIDFPLSSSLTVDLDLQIFDSRGVQVGYSGSWDNSFEIAEFEGRPGETYTIKIRRWSGTDNVWYGIAWTVTGGLFWADVTRFTVLQERMNGRRRR
jgi:hypothetical protein